MSTILMLRDKSTFPGESALLEQQAVCAITRSILATYSEEGMIASEHKIILPVHLDILPLVCLIANDYTEFIEPEPERISQGAPFILYSDHDEEYQEKEYDLVLANLIPSTWFVTEYLQFNLRDIISKLRPDICIVIGEGSKKLKNLENLNYRFQRMIAFHVFSADAVAEEYSSMADSFTMADNNFISMLREGMNRLDVKYENTDQFSMWANLFTGEESRPELEQFVNFGAATEMALFRDNSG